jgi:hypothetical protein
VVVCQKKAAKIRCQLRARRQRSGLNECLCASGAPAAATAATLAACCFTGCPSYLLLLVAEYCLPLWFSPTALLDPSLLLSTSRSSTLLSLFFSLSSFRSSFALHCPFNSLRREYICHYLGGDIALASRPSLTYLLDRLLLFWPCRMPAEPAAASVLDVHLCS